MRVAIIKYNAGNILSVYNALKRFGIDAIITEEHEEILKSDKVIFPGVGEAVTTMKYLKEHKLDKLIKNLKQPLLGICLGMQLMCSQSEEGNTACLGIFNIKVRKFNSGLNRNSFSTNNEQRTTNPDFIGKQLTTIKVPQIGWNTINELKGKLFNKIPEGQYVYFVHSYYAEKGSNTAAVTDYGIQFSAALEKDNFFATQFHPEKSGKIGERILQNFLKL